jgi:hypothetical protein
VKNVLEDLEFYGIALAFHGEAMSLRQIVRCTFFGAKLTEPAR